LGLPVLQHGKNFFQLDFRQQRQVLCLEVEALGAQRHLARRFLAADIQRGQGRRQMRQGLQQQCGLADAGIAANQHHPTANNAVTQHAIEFRNPGRNAFVFHRLDLGQ